MTYRLNICQGEASEHALFVGDGKSGKTTFVRNLLKKLPSAYKYWAYDYNHNGFIGCGKPVKDLSEMIDGNVQYIPQVKDRKEMDDFVRLAMDLGERLVVLDEYHTQQNAKYISPLQAQFLRTYRHPRTNGNLGGSWFVIAQSPLNFNEAVFNNVDHIFAFFMATENRHIQWYLQKFGRVKTATLVKAHTIAKAKKLPRPFIHKGKDDVASTLYTPEQPLPKLTAQEIQDILGK